MPDFLPLPTWDSLAVSPRVLFLWGMVFFLGTPLLLQTTDLQAQESALQEPAPAALESSATGDLEARTAQLLKNLWWNQEKVVTTLALGEDQRRRMDVLFTDFRLASRDLRQAPPEALERYRRALAAGDLQTARQALVVRGERAARIATAESTLVLDVLAVLRDEQLRTLITRFPKLLNQPWYRQFGREGGLAGRRSGARRHRGPRRPAAAPVTPPVGEEPRGGG